MTLVSDNAGSSGDVRVTPGAAYVNLSTLASHVSRNSLLQVQAGFQITRRILPRALFASLHGCRVGIEGTAFTWASRAAIRKNYGYHLMASYNALPNSQKTLSDSECETLKLADDVHNDEKGFEYIDIRDAMTGYKRYPDLDHLDQVARKLLWQLPEDPYRPTSIAGHPGAPEGVSIWELPKL